VHASPPPPPAPSPAPQFADNKHELLNLGEVRVHSQQQQQQQQRTELVSLKLSAKGWTDEPVPPLRTDCLLGSSLHVSCANSCQSDCVRNIKDSIAQR
jgi:hypothetical protein